MSIPSELGHLAVPINHLPTGNPRWRKRVSNQRPFDPESYAALPLRHTVLARAYRIEKPRRLLPGQAWRNPSRRKTRYSSVETLLAAGVSFGRRRGMVFHQRAVNN